ncbi:MAG: HK97 family phage prohead protease [Methanobrevibacter sp.]|nr:HK97 family phage prohead protease [Methanobrevibacter sp.]
MNKLYTRAIIDQNENDESRTITGKAISFDTPSQYIGYIEYINRDAITQELIDTSDIIMNYQHDDTRMLARWTKGKGTLNVELREDGVYFSFECPDTTLGNDILWHIRHGNLQKCSFAFTLPDDQAIRWFRNDDNELCGEIMRIDGLYDLSIVTTPAYEDTYVDAREFDLEAVKRSLDESKSQNEKISIFNILEEKRKNILNYIQ